MRLEFRPIAAPDPSDAALSALAEVILAAPSYSMLVEGRLPTANDARELVTDLPPGRDYADKFVYGLWVEERMVGCVDILRGWKHAGQSMIGLLLIREDEQGRGWGRQAVAGIEDIVRGWPGMTSLRIGVVSTNQGGLAFWRRMGFAENGQRVQLPQYLGETIILEKPLH